MLKALCQKDLKKDSKEDLSEAFLFLLDMNSYEKKL